MVLLYVALGTCVLCAVATYFLTIGRDKHWGKHRYHYRARR
jgi:hypothetical protein